MKAKAGLKLRRVGNRHMLVDVSATAANVTYVYTFNDTAAFVWSLLAEGDADIDDLVMALCDEFDIDSHTAVDDVKELVGMWKNTGIITD